MTATALIAGLFTSAQAGTKGKVEDLGTPIETYLILDTVLAPDAHGRPTLYGSTYNVPSDPGVTFFGVDPVTGAIRTKKVMPGAYGGYHVTAAPNGRIYLGPLNARSRPEIWEYNPVTDTVRIAATAPEGLFCFGMAASPNGHVYCGAYGKGIYDYDPATGKLRFVVNTETYPKGLLPLGKRRLVVAQGTPASVLVLDVKTGRTTDVLPKKYRNYSFAYNAVRILGSVYIQLVTPDVKILRFDATTMKFLGEVPTITGMSFAPLHQHEFVAAGPNPGQAGTSEFYRVKGNQKLRVSATGVSAEWSVGPRVGRVKIGHDTWLTSIGVHGLLGRWDPKTGEVWTHQLTLPGNPTRITAMTRAPDGRICGGTYETNALFCYDPTSGQTKVLGIVAPGRTGEILSMQSADGKLFMGSYIDNVVTVYDPSRPWNPGETATSNPRDLGPVGDQQYRPWDMTLGPDGRVWVASSAAYGVLSGALTAIDPQTYRVQSFRGLAGQQHMFSVTSTGHVLVAGTSTYGDNTDAGGVAQVLVVDPTTGKATSSTPVAGARRIYALATAPDGTVYGSADNGTWFRFDASTHRLTSLGAFRYGQVYGLVEGPDGDIYGNTVSTVFRVDPASNAVTAVATPGTDCYRCLAFDQAGRLYWNNDTHLVRTTP